MKGNTMKTQTAKSFLKWAGGKSQLIGQLETLFPPDLAKWDCFTYVEPFLGGGSMLFHMLGKYKNIRQAVVNDMNGSLIASYRAVRDCPADLISRLKHLRAGYLACQDEAARREFYMKIRDAYNGRGPDKTETAALFIFLNKTCFNGLHRVNSKGLFNVPFGKAANPAICDEETIMADSMLLRNVQILNGDFADTYRHVKGRAFFYFDPPYRPLPKAGGFTAYQKGGFDDGQRERLAGFCRTLDSAGHKWLLSNSDPANTDPADRFFDRIFSGFNINRVLAGRMINSDGKGRGKVTELAIRNY